MWSPDEGAAELEKGCERVEQEGAAKEAFLIFGQKTQFGNYVVFEAPISMEFIFGVLMDGYRLVCDNFWPIGEMKIFLHPPDDIWDGWTLAWRVDAITKSKTPLHEFSEMAGLHIYTAIKYMKGDLF